MARVKKLPCPQRLRQIPLQFSWVDHRLVQLGYLDRCDPPAAALYLFLVTVADAQGLSYYGEATLAARLHLDGATLCAARRRLIELRLIAYVAPIYQVLAVDAAPGETSVAVPATMATTTPAPPATTLTAATPPIAQMPDRAAAAALLARLRGQLERRRGRL